jgi:hypothetical protein
MSETGAEGILPQSEEPGAPAGPGPNEVSPASREASPGEPTQERDPVPYDKFAQTQRERTRFKSEAESLQAELDTYRQVYGTMGAEEAIAHGLNQPTAEQPPLAPSAGIDPDGGDDGDMDVIFNPLLRKFESALEKRLAPMEKVFAQQQQQALQQRINADLTRLSEQYPDHFDRKRDWPVILSTIRRGHAKSIEGAFKYAYFDRIALGGGGGPAASPGHEIAGTSGAQRASGDEDLAKLRKTLRELPPDSERREDLVGRIATLKLRRSGFFAQQQE